MVHRLIRRLFSNDREEEYKGRKPSSKPKDSKVEKMIKLAQARFRKGKKVKAVKNRIQKKKK